MGVGANEGALEIESCLECTTSHALVGCLSAIYGLCTCILPGCSSMILRDLGGGAIAGVELRLFGYLISLRALWGGSITTEESFLQYSVI